MEQTDKAIAAKVEMREKLMERQTIATPLAATSTPLSPEKIKVIMRKLKSEDPKLTEQELGSMIGLKRLTFRRFMDNMQINEENMGIVIKKATERFNQ